MIDIKKIYVYILLFILLFQETIQRMIPSLSFLDFFDEIIVVLFTMLALIEIFKTKKINKIVLILFLLLICFYVTGSISLYKNSNFIFTRYLGSSFLAIKCFLLIIDISIIGLNEKTKRISIDVLNSIGILNVLVGLFNFVFPSIYSKICPFAIVTYRFGFVSITSLFYHTGRFGWFMLFLSIMNYVLYRSNKNSKNKKLFVLFGIFSLLSFRTKVILSILTILIVNVTLSKKIELKKIVTASCFVLLIVALFHNVILNAYYLYFDDNQSTVSARQSISKNSYKIVEDYFPLGVGFGQYGSFYAKKYYSEYYYKYNMTNIYGLSPNDAFFATDNFWGCILGETGFLGTTFYILFLIYVFLLLKHNLKFDATFKSSEIYFGILVLIQSIAESSGEQSFNSPPQYIFLAITVGIAIYESINKSEMRYANEKEKNTICNVKSL